MFTLKVVRDDTCATQAWHADLSKIEWVGNFEYSWEKHDADPYGKEGHDLIGQAFSRFGKLSYVDSWQIAQFTESATIGVIVVANKIGPRQDNRPYGFIYPSGCGYILGNDGKTIDRVG